MKYFTNMVLWAVMFSSTTLFAQGFVNWGHMSSPGQMQMSLGFSSLEFEIESDDTNGNNEIERQILGLGVNYGFQSDMNVYAYFGFSIESTAEDVTGDDQGFLVGGGVKARVYQQGKMKLNVFGDLSYAMEEYGEILNQNVEGTLFEFKLGATVAATLVQNFEGFVGVQLTPFSDGNIEIGSSDTDMERDDVFAFVLGANLFLKPNIIIRPEVAVLSDQRFSIVVDAAI